MLRIRTRQDSHQATSSTESITTHHGSQLVYNIYSITKKTIKDSLAYLWQRSRPTKVQTEIEIAENNKKLHDAIRFGDLELVNTLLVAKVNPNSVDKDGITPLASAIQHRQIDIFKSLIAHKADVTQIDEKGYTLLHKAVQINQKDNVEILLEAKVNVNHQAKNKDTALYLSVDKDYRDVTNLLLTAKANPNLGYDNGWTPIFCAANNGFHVTTQLLLEHKVDVHKQYNNATPIFHAAINNHIEILKIIIKLAGAKAVSIQGLRGLTPLMVAAEKASVESVQLLLDTKPDLDVCNETGDTAISQAVYFKRADIFKLLLQSGANLHLTNRNNQTLLHIAAMNGQMDIVLELMKAGLPINAVDSYNNTASDYAAQNRHKDTVIALMQASNILPVTTEDESKLYTLPEFKTFPQKIVISEESKRLFAEGRECPDDWSLGQGFAVIAWKNKIGDEDVLQIELVPAFNKDDGKPRSNNNNIPYYIFNPEEMLAPTQDHWKNIAVEAPEPLGRNSGVVHQHAIEVLKLSGRIPIGLNKNNMFGLGILKGNASNLLAQFRNKSANINSESVRYNRIFELMKYTVGSGEYFTKRALPSDISDKICDALLTELPTVYDKRTCRIKNLENADEEKDWEKDTLFKINKLIATLSMHIEHSFTDVDNKLVEELLFYIKKLKNQSRLELININLTSTMSAILRGAIQRGCQAAVISQLLAAGATPYGLSSRGDSAFDIAHTFDRNNIIHQLLDYHYDFVKSINRELKLTKLMEAGESFLPEIKEILESKDKPDIEIPMPDGRTFLELAIMKNSLVLTNLILQYKQDKDLSKDKSRLIFHAIKANNKDIIEVLVKNNAKLIFPTFVEACRKCSGETVKLLLNKIIEEDYLIDEIDDDDETPLIAALLKNQFDVAQILLDAGADINVRYKNQSFIETALSKDNFKLTEFLLTHKANITEKALETLVNKALEAKNIELLDLLIKHGEISKSPSLSGKVIRFAAKYNVLNLMQTLTNKEYKFDLNMIDECGETPAHIASLHNNFGILTILQAAGADMHITSKNGLTPLLQALYNNNNETAKFIITNTKNINTLTICDKPFLYYAVERRNKEIIKLLLDNKENINSNKFESNPLMKAAHSGYVDGLRLMLQPEYKIDVNQPCLSDDKDENNSTASMSAAACNQAEALQLLIEAKADLYKSTDNGNTALHWTAYGHVTDKTLPLLLEYKMDINLRNKVNGQTPLFIAAQNNQLNNLKNLLDYKANILIPDFKGMTPLHIAAKNGHTDIVRFLLKHNANISSLDNNKLSALQHAIENKHWSIVKYFIHHNQLSEIDKRLLQKFKQEIAWHYYETSLTSMSPGQAPIVPLLMKSTSLFHKLQDDYLVKNRHLNEELQEEYDKIHGVVLYASPRLK